MTYFKKDEEANKIIFMDDKYQFNSFKLDNITDLQTLVDLLIDEHQKAEEKQNNWFEKYWIIKRKLNKIINTIAEEE